MTGISAVQIINESEDGREHHWAGIARILGPVWTQLPSLTLGLFGVQMLWSVEMSYASPYLLSLGLSKSLMAIVFLAGPLSGLIVQPLIGILSDNSKSRFGRRRPFIIVCAALCSLATLLLGFTRQFATIFATLKSPSNNVLTIWLAILSIYCMDFSINAVQALDRALLVDTLPTARQPAGNAWAARMLAFGSVAGFFVGNLDLVHYFPFFGNAQLQVLSVIAALLLFSTQAWMAFHVKERVLLDSSDPKGFRRELKELLETLVRLPSVIRQICWIQFFAWLGWFPVLFYSTVYIGDIYKNSSPIPESEDATIALDVEATRLGTRALFYSALVSLVANIALPYCVTLKRARHTSSPLSKRKSWSERVRIHLASLWALSHLIFAICMVATFVTSTVYGATMIIVVTGFCWAITQWVPFALLGEAILSHQCPDDAGSIHLTDTRSTHALHLDNDVEHNAEDEETQQLFGADIDNEDEQEQGWDGLDGYHDHRRESTSTSRPLSHNHAREFDSRPRIIGLGDARARVSGLDIAIPCTPPSSAHTEGNAMMSMQGPSLKSASSLGAQAGAILGIHNLFIVIPQFLVTGLSSIIFAVFDPDKSVLHGHLPGNAQPLNGTDPTSQHGSRQLLVRSAESSETGPNSIAIIFRLGGLAAVIAFVLTYRLAKELKHC